MPNLFRKTLYLKTFFQDVARSPGTDKLRGAGMLLIAISSLLIVSLTVVMGGSKFETPLLALWTAAFVAGNALFFLAERIVPRH